MNTDRMKRFGTGAALVAAGGIAALTLSGLAIADDSSTATPDSTQGQEWAPGQGRGPMGGHGGGMEGRGGGFGGPDGGLIHGNGVARDAEGDLVTVQMQTGTVKAASDTSITVASEDGFTATYTINTDTDVHRDRSDVTGSAIKTGDTVRVMAEKSGATLVAVHVGAMSPDAVAEMEQHRQEMQNGAPAQSDDTTGADGSSGT